MEVNVYTSRDHPNSVTPQANCLFGHQCKLICLENRANETMVGAPGAFQLQPSLSPDRSQGQAVGKGVSGGLKCGNATSLPTPPPANGSRHVTSTGTSEGPHILLMGFKEGGIF